MTRFKLLCFALLVLLAAGTVLAQEQTAAIQGTVVDASGAALPGVTVEAVSTRGARFTSVTDGAGRYRFPSIAPGTYNVSATLSGMQTATSRNVSVTLGSTPRVDLTMRMAQVAETLTVTAEAPVVDVTSSAAAANIRSETFERLPKGRDFSSVVALAPGAKNEDAAGGMSIDGASGAENRWVIDGVDTTQPRTGVQGKTMITDFVDEVQVKSAGYAAEFGGAMGGVINVITKTGTNDFRGDVLSYYTSNDLGGGTRRPQLQLNAANPTLAEAPVYAKDKDVRLEPGFGVGGPILRDRLWFFGSYQPQLRTFERTVDFVNASGAPLGISKTLTDDYNTNYATANINGVVGSSLSYKVAGSLSPSTEKGTRLATIPSSNGRGNPTANYDLGAERENSSYSGYADWIGSSKFVVGAKAGMFHTNYKDIGVPAVVRHFFSTTGKNPVTTFPEVPAAYAKAPGYSNVPTNRAIAQDIYERQSASLDASFFPTLFGTHSIKGGVLLENVKNNVADTELRPLITYNWDLTHSGSGQRGKYGYFTVRQFKTGGDVKATNTGLFLQDSWTMANRLTVNYGVRAESEDVPSYHAGAPSFIKFDYQDKLAPRLGFSYDVTGNGRSKVYGSYGKFYDVIKLEWPRGSSGGDVWVDYHFKWDDYDFTKNDNCSVGNNTSSEKPTGCGAGTFIVASDRRAYDPAETASAFDPGIKPVSSQEFSLGGQQEIGTRMSVGLRYVHKEILRTIEDMGILGGPTGDDEIWYYGNPGYCKVCASVQAANTPAQPKAVRDYDGYELEFTKRFEQNWSFHASYLYSRLFGNYSGLASSDEVIAGAGIGRTSPNVNRQFDGLAQSFTQNLTPSMGLLATDRTHQIKAQAAYTFPFGTTASLNQYWGSGTPSTTEVNVYPQLPFFPFGRGDMGRTPNLTQTDLYLAHEIKFGGRYGLQFSLNVLNLFDEDTPTYLWNRLLKTDLPSQSGVTQAAFFSHKFDVNAILNGLAANPATASLVQRDPRYGQPYIYQDPRSVRLGARLRF